MTATADAGWIGRSLERREDLRLLTGRGEYLADLRVPDCLHLCFVRSDHAHAKIRDIRLEAALAMPGVVGAITGAQLSQEIQGQKIPVLIPAFAANYRQYWPLAVDEAYWHGEPLAAIVAEDKYAAEDAAAVVEVDYEPLPIVTDPEAALREDAPLVYDDWDSNEIFGTSYTGGFDPDEIAQNDAEVEALFAQADVVLRQRFRTQRCGACPIETRGALAIWSETDGLTVHLTTQRPHIERLALADLLELSTAEVRVVAPRDQGGGFGVKAPFYREHVVVCHLARKLGRPVRWIETREEHLMTVSQERDQIHDLEIAADREGRILALRNRGIGDVGDGRQGVYWGFVMPSLGSVMLPNAYAIGHADIKLRCAVTNKTCVSPSRSFGALPTRFTLERGLDMLARRLDMETAALKRRNLVTEFPFTSVTGVHHDSGDYVKAWDALIESVDLAGFRVLQREARAEGRYIGIGFACGAEFSGIPSDVLVPLENQPGYGVVTMRIDPRGKVAIHEGDAPQGQSHETTMAQVAADAFGIHPDDVSVRHGDTGTTPLSSGTIGARGASYTTAAIAEAAAALKAKMARYMIHDHGLEGASPDDFSFADGAVVYEKDGNIRREFAALGGSHRHGLDRPAARRGPGARAHGLFRSAQTDDLLHRASRQGRGRYRDRAVHDPRLRHLRRRRHGHQPHRRRGPGSGRRGTGHVERDVRGVPLRRERPAADRGLRELPPRICGGRPERGGGPFADALAPTTPWAFAPSAKAGRGRCPLRSPTPSAMRLRPSASRSRPSPSSPK